MEMRIFQTQFCGHMKILPAKVFCRVIEPILSHDPTTTEKKLLFLCFSCPICNVHLVLPLILLSWSFYVAFLCTYTRIYLPHATTPTILNLLRPLDIEKSDFIPARIAMNLDLLPHSDLSLWCLIPLPRKWFWWFLMVCPVVGLLPSPQRPQTREEEEEKSAHRGFLFFLSSVPTDREIEGETASRESGGRNWVLVFQLRGNWTNLFVCTACTVKWIAHTSCTKNVHLAFFFFF